MLGLKKGPVCCGHCSKPPCYPEDTVSALRPHRSWKALLGVMCPGGAGEWVLHRSEMGKSFGNTRGPSWESFVSGVQVGKEDRRRRSPSLSAFSCPPSMGRSHSQVQGRDMLTASAASCPHLRSKEGMPNA